MLRKKLLIISSILCSMNLYAQKPNVVLIVADDLGYSDIGSYGGEIRTPNLDELAKRGTRFTNYHTPSKCSPTRAELMSGTDHHLSGIGAMAETMRADAAKFHLKPKPHLLGRPGYEGYINNRSLTLPNILKENGYRTLMVGKWHLGFTPETNPKSKGFQYSYALLNGADSHFKTLPEGIERKTIYTENGIKVELPDEFYSTDYFTDKMIEYIGNEKSPFFAYVAYTSPHWPLQVPEKYLDKYKGQYDVGYEVIKNQRLKKMKDLNLVQSLESANVVPQEVIPGKLANWDNLTKDQREVEARKMEIYASMVENMDDNIGRLINHLKSINQFENTLFIFISDNGAEGFYRPVPGYDNSFDNIGKPKSYAQIGPRWSEVSSAPLSLWKATAGEGGISAPAIVKMPFNNTQKIDNNFVSVKDIFPTILDFTKSKINNKYLNSKEYNQITGKSWFKLLNNKSKTVYGDNFIYADELHGDIYIRNKDWKLTKTITDNLNGPDWRLYNISNDRSERYNVIDQYPEIKRKLLKEYDKYVKKVGVQDFTKDN